MSAKVKVRVAPANDDCPESVTPALPAIEAAREIQAPAIEFKAVADLKTNPRNARTHSKKQVQLIASSIREFGFLVPILIDEDGMILAGHGRYEASRLLKMRGVPIISVKHLTGLSPAS
jgi:hypothetical protein